MAAGADTQGISLIPLFSRNSGLIFQQRINVSSGQSFSECVYITSLLIQRT